MATRPPPQTKAILATPLNVEESKAQRQQRSQARFRDRGGIFVPSNRNTLADILLGKAPPLTKPRKSVSASPSLRRQSKGRRSSPRKSNANVLRRSESPVKKSRKSTNGGSREVVANIEPSTEPNVAAASTKTHKGKQPAKPAARRSSTKGSKPAQEEPPSEDRDSHSNVNPESPTKAGTTFKPSKKSVPKDVETRPSQKKPKPKAKRASKDAGQNALPETEDSTELKKAAGKRGPRASAQPKSAAINATESNNERQHQPSTSAAPKTTKTNVPKVSNAPVAVSSSAEAGPSTSARPKGRKSGDLYSCGESEDEYVPKVSKKKKAPARTSSSKKTAPAKKPAAPKKSALPAIMEEDEDPEEEETHSSSNLQHVSSMSASKNKPEKAFSSALKSSSSKTKASTAESSKSSRPKASKATDSQPEIKAKNSKSGKGSSAKGKEAPTSDEGTLEIAPHKAGRASSTKSNKRRAHDIDPPEEEPEPPSKRPKSSGKATQNVKTTSGPKKAASNKRSRDEDDTDTAADAKDVRPKKSAKRKKTAEESDTNVPAPSKTKKGTTPAAAAKAKKPTSKDSNDAKKAVKKFAKKTGQKENSSSENASKPQAPIVKRGPPKSVLARIKASAQTHEVDNDPDEIDFLS